MKMGKGELKDWLLWLAGKLIDERISFSMNESGGQWTVSVENEAASRRVGALTREWKAQHEMRS